MFKASVRVTLRQSVHDPQGNAVKRSLHALGFDGVKDVRVGKLLELEVDVPNRAQAEEQVVAMCEKLLANPVIETYTVSVEEADS